MKSNNNNRNNWRKFQGGNWKGRSLSNYKTQQRKRAEKKGVLKELLNCTTLTKARKILSGEYDEIK